MYESFLPDLDGASLFYNRHQSSNLNNMFASYAERYFNEYGIDYTIERDVDCIKFSTSKGLFVLSLRNNTPTVVSVYSIPNSFITQFRNSIWVNKTIFGFPVSAVIDQADDGYFETHPSRFNVIIFPKV